MRPHNDLVALALSTLCGRRYKSIHFGLPVSDRVVDGIGRFSLAAVTAAGNLSPVSIEERSGLTLNFSGGFDSLAARCLLPEGTNLVSMDFGGRFARENKFFRRFEPFTVTTNLVETPLRTNSWSFMGIASILTASHFATRYQCFGSILEAGPENFAATAATVGSRTEVQPFSSCGIDTLPIVRGLTEVGTLLVLARYLPDLIGPSLLSLASPGEEKLYRKYLLARSIEDRRGIDLGLPVVDPPGRPPFRFGQSLAADFLSVYLARFAGQEAVERTIAHLPQEVIDLSRTLELRFYDRFNPSFISAVPASILGRVVERLADAGIVPYDESDWREFALVA